MLREFKECLVELYDSLVEILTTDRWETVTDQQAADAIGTTLGVIDTYVMDGMLRVDRDGEIYRRSLDKFIADINSY